MSVRAKLWTTTATILVLMGATAVAMHIASKNAAETALTETVKYEERIKNAVKWKGMIDANIQRLVANTLTSDPAITNHFQSLAKEASATITTLQKSITAEATLDQEQQALSSIADRRSALLDVLKSIDKQKQSGDLAAAVKAVHDQMLPALDVYVAGLDNFIQVEASLRDEAAQSAAQHASRVEMAGAAIFALVLLVSAWTVALLVRSICRPLDEAVNFAGAIASGDLTRKLSTDRDDEIGRLTTAMGNMSDRLQDVIGNVLQGVESVSTASSQIATGNVDLSQRTEKQAASLQQTAASMEQLTSTIKQNAESAKLASDLASSATEVASRGGKVVSEVVTTMDAIAQSSRRITEIIAVIDGIAFQTNILALNAAVEAARAGDQGRGFAVVAGEVRALAKRSAQAASEIKSLIEQSVEKVDNGSQLVSEAGKTMADIVQQVKRVSDLVGDIEMASAEQSQGVEQIGLAVSHLDQVTQQNAALVEESAAAAESMMNQATMLADSVSIFNVGSPAQVADGMSQLAGRDRVTRSAAPSSPSARESRNSFRPAAPRLAGAMTVH